MLDFLAGQGGRLQKTTGEVAIHAAKGVLPLDGAHPPYPRTRGGDDVTTGVSLSFVKLAQEEPKKVNTQDQEDKALFVGAGGE
jgi:hypothetical protein